VLSEETRQEGAAKVTNTFLGRFYEDRIVSHFAGSQRYNRADDFLQELLMESPRMIQVSEDVTALIDPIRIAELILYERAKVAMEWKELARVSPEEHFKIRQLMLNRMMGIEISQEQESQ
jgi:hypothetical protein